MDEEPEFKKPTKKRALSVHEFRKLVIARHKYLVTIKPVEEAVELLQEEHGADEDSCLRLIEFLKGGKAEEPPTKGALERTHVVCDPETGDEHQIETRPGSIPPRPV